ncbi:hypothetical protein [Marinobacter sp.]|uniref:hypothetical protein n=1 Tax=Marinobacter sp. TaxID=50741 RepID=UPI00384DE39D
MKNNEASFLRWNQPKVVTYLSEKEKSSLELDVKGNLIVVKETGQPFDTGEALMGPGAIFIMEPSGRILASNYSKPREFHHSSLSGGLPVASAGHMEVADGHLLEVNSYSGHYEPTQRQNNLIFQELESRGLPASITDNVMQGGWTEDGVSTKFKPHKNFRNIQ